MWISSLQDLMQNRSLEINPIDNVVLDYPHDNIDGNHMNDECRKLIVPIVCHRIVVSANGWLSATGWPAINVCARLPLPAVCGVWSLGSCVFLAHASIPGARAHLDAS